MFMDQSTPRTEASVPNRLNLQTIPAEVQNQIASLLPSTVLRDLYGMLRFTLSSQEDNHSRAWRSIFKKDDWLKTVTFDYGTVVVLLGPTMHECYSSKGRRGSMYAALAAYNQIEDRKDTNFRSLEKQKFFDSLCDGYDYDKVRREINFPSGIILNAQGIFSTLMEIYVDPVKLFDVRRRGIRTQYIVWSDLSRKLRRAKPAQFEGYFSGFGLRGEVPRPNQDDFICEMTIKTEGVKPFGLWFAIQPSLDVASRMAERRLSNI
jgi:hypothetical protein